MRKGPRYLSVEFQTEQRTLSTYSPQTWNDLMEDVTSAESLIYGRFAPSSVRPLE